VPDLLVTGTDTGVGKTLIAAALVLALRDRGLKAIAWKPVESGVLPSEPADSEILALASGVEDPLAQPLLRLHEALAPAVAAERSGVALPPAAVEARLDALRRKGYSVVVEGAGGLLAPLAWDYTALDLARRAKLEAVIVGRPGLGTINHVLLTHDALVRAGVRVRGAVLNGRGDPPDLAEQTNPEALGRLLPRVKVIVTPRLAGSPIEMAQALRSTLGVLA